MSDASNLVAGDTNGSTDVFVRDVAGAVTTRVSLAAEDGLERTGASGDLSGFTGRQFDISDDGRFVVFTSRAPLTATDTLICAPEGVPVNCPDVYLRDRQTNATVRVSLGLGGAPPDGASARPRISGDGSWIVFESTASNLVLGDTNGVTDVFLLNRQTLTITRISLSTTGSRPTCPARGRDQRRRHRHRVRVGVGAPQHRAGHRGVRAGPPVLFAPFHRRSHRRHDPAHPAAGHRNDEGLRLRHNHLPGEAGSVAVAPDGASIAVTAGIRAIVITISTGFSSIGWIYDRAGGKSGTSVTAPRSPPGTAPSRPTASIR